MLCNLFDGFFHVFAPFLACKLHFCEFYTCTSLSEFYAMHHVLLAKIRLFIFSPMYFSCSKMFFVGSHAYDVWFDNLCRFLQ